MVSALCPCMFPVDVRDVYAFEEKIGAGAFGQVRRARRVKKGGKRDPQVGEMVAVKIILKAEQGVSYEELMIEIECLKKINSFVSPAAGYDGKPVVGCPNIVRYFGYYTDERFIYIAMEEFPGGELMHRLRQKQLGKRKIYESEAARYIKMIVNALEFLARSEISVVHRDIKPENFLFKNTLPSSELALIDFGLSQTIKENDWLATCCGTVQYISPEQIRGKYRFTGDMWAVGICTYLLLVGSFPFKGDSDSKMMSAILSEKSLKIDAPMTDDAKDFIKKVLEHNTTTRLTPTQAKQHPWITGIQETGIKSEDREISSDVLQQAYVVVQSSRRIVDTNREAERDSAFMGQSKRRQSLLGRMSRSSVVTGTTNNPLNNMMSTIPSSDSSDQDNIIKLLSWKKKQSITEVTKSKFHDNNLNYTAMQFRKSHSIAMGGDVFGTLLQTDISSPTPKNYSTNYDGSTNNNGLVILGGNTSNINNKMLSSQDSPVHSYQNRADLKEDFRKDLESIKRGNSSVTSSKKDGNEESPPNTKGSNNKRPKKRSNSIGNAQLPSYLKDLSDRAEGLEKNHFEPEKGTDFYEKALGKQHKFESTRNDFKM